MATPNTNITLIKLVYNDFTTIGNLEVNSDCNLKENLGNIKQMITKKIRDSDYEIK